MAELFKAAGFEDFKSMEVGKFYKPKNKIGIASYENNKKVVKEIEYLVYKGESKGGYKIITPTSVFMATGIHKLYDAENDVFVEVEKIQNKENFIGLDINGNKVSIIIEKCDDAFSILDMQVKDTHTYFSGGILSHNTFGAGAKALKEFCNRFNILCANYNTTMFVISQERAQMAQMSHAIATTGGYALKYVASTLNRVRKIENLTEGSKIVGIHMQVRNYKNKTGIPFRECEMDLYYKGGFDSTGEFVDFLYEFAEDPRLLKLVDCRSKGYYNSKNNFGWNFHGKDAFVAAINNGEVKPTEWEQIKQTIQDIISHEIEGKEFTGDEDQIAEQDLTKEKAEELSKAEIEAEESELKQKTTFVKADEASEE